MKKMIVLLTMLIAGSAKADWLSDQIDAAFVGHAKAAMEFRTDGKAQAEFLDNFFEIGKFNGSPIAATDLGISGTVLPDSGKLEGLDFTTGAKIHFAPLIKSWITLNSEWQFINNLELDGRASYDWRLHHPFYGFAIGYPFK